MVVRGCGTKGFEEGLIAGFFYGEGSVVQPKGVMNGRLVFWNTSQASLEFIQRIIGGKIKRREPRGLSKLPIYHLEILDKVRVERLGQILLRVPLIPEKANKLRELLKHFALIQPAKNHYALHNVTKDELEGLYVKQNFSINKIARKFGVTRSSICEKMDKVGIPRRYRGVKPTTKIAFVGRETFRQMYWSEGMSMTDIGRRYACHTSQVLFYMRKYSIPRRPRGDAVHKHFSMKALEQARENV